MDKMNEVLGSFKEQCQMLYTSYLLAEPQGADSELLGGATRSANTSKISALDDLVTSIVHSEKELSKQ